MQYTYSTPETTTTTEETVREYDSKGKLVREVKTVTTVRTPQRTIPQTTRTYPMWDSGRIWCGSITSGTGTHTTTIN